MKQGKRIFRRIIRKTAPIHHPLLAIDIENNPDTGKFINAALYGEIRNKNHKNHKKHTFIEQYFTNQDKFTDYLEGLRPEGMKALPTKIILFNASYDYWFLMKITDDNRLLTSGGNVISGRLKNGIPIMDLTNLTRKGSLEDWIAYLKGEGIEIPEKESLEDLEKRVKSDAKATWILGNYLEKFFIDEIGIPLRLTNASAARYLFGLRFFTDFWKRDEKQFWISDYERKAYRGGRVEAFIRGLERIFVGYDVNSMYLSIMRDKLMPDPNTASFTDEITELPKDTLYIADVTVSVPKQHVGPLPYKGEECDGKLIFPTGAFRGYYASPELNYAIKECGVTVNEIHSIIKYTGSKRYFEEYAKFIWKKRKEYKDKGNKGMEILIKYLGNTLYGGFGQKNKDSYLGKTADLDMDFIDSLKNVFAPATIEGTDYVTITEDKGEDSEHTFPCLPVFITSYARLMLLKALRANKDKITYCDTDSMKLRNTPQDIEVGDNLGEWGYEGVEIDVEIYKSKMYGTKCKGIPKRADLVWNDDERRIYTYRKPNKMRESFKRGLIPAQWNKTTKEVVKQDDKRVWITDKDSKPLELPF